jgi:hypothetical protein
MKEYHKYLRALSTETYYPFEATMFHTECPNKPNVAPPLGAKEFPPPPKRPAPPPKVLFDKHSNGHEHNPSHEHLRILYVMLVHNNVDFVQQLVYALNEPQHTFVIHVDLKAPDVQETLSRVFGPADPAVTAANATGFPDHYDRLIDYSIPVRQGGGKFGNVWVMQEEREACNWGGFTIVNATLNALRLAILTLRRPFDYCMDVSGTSYPIKTNNVGVLALLLLFTISSQPSASLCM